MTLTEQELAAENEIETITLLRIDHPKWLVEVFRLSDEAWDVLHIDVQTSDVLEAEDMPAFADAVAGAYSFVEKWRGGGHA